MQQFDQNVAESVSVYFCELEYGGDGGAARESCLRHFARPTFIMHLP